MVNAKYFMGASKGHSRKSDSDFYTVSVLYVDGYGNWSCKGFYCTAAFLDAVQQMIDEGFLAIGDPVTVSVFEKNIEDICRDDRFFESLNLNQRKPAEKKSPDSKS